MLLYLIGFGRHNSVKIFLWASTSNQGKLIVNSRPVYELLLRYFVEVLNSENKGAPDELVKMAQMMLFNPELHSASEIQALILASIIPLSSYTKSIGKWLQEIVNIQGITIEQFRLIITPFLKRWTLYNDDVKKEIRTSLTNIPENSAIKDVWEIARMMYIS